MVGTAILVVQIVKYAKENGTKATLEAACKYAANIITAVGLKLVTDAERTYGDGTGQLKMASAVAELLKILPDWVVKVVPKEWIQSKLEEVLSAAKEKWKSNPNLLK